MNHHVEPGDALTFELGGGLTCHKLSVGPMDNNAYLLSTTSAAAVLIDAAHEADRLLSAIADLPPTAMTLRAVVTTHQHADHVQALAEVIAATSAQAFSGRPDAPAIESATGVAQRGLWTGDRVEVGEGYLSVLGVVGHTPGSIVLAWTPSDGPAQLFTGDSLFPGGPGKTGTSSDFESLMSDLETTVFARFADDTMVHPGHGDSTTLGAERPHLSQWRARGW